jgi:superfamily I DNA and/or RNA helicase
MHRRSGTSWTRPAEATAIARQLQAWITSEAGREFSYGVISFYKAQAELIKDQLQTISDDDKRLRVGTVDAFQGMEFDVVFLSVVRACPQSKRATDDDREKQARNLFGHLCLYNRLNVSMSRQIKLLVVAGDSALLKNDLAEEYVPGLVDFFSLCQAEGRVLQCR